MIQRSGCCSLDVYITPATVSGDRAQRSGFTKLAELAAKEIGRHRNKPTAPVALFGGIAPRLEVLAVNAVPMDWTSSFIRGLKELDLSHMTDGEISTQQVLEILSITPLLEKIRIHNSILGHRFRPLQEPRTIIQLPNMKTIDLTEINELAIGIILSSIQAPDCTSLVARGWEENGVTFPEPALTHFADFLRQTLSANNNSQLGFYDNGLEWYSRSGGVGGPDFALCIRYGATTIGVEWATSIIGLGAHELVHDLELTISRSGLAENDFAAYHSISRWQSVTSLTVEYGNPPPRPILDLFGSLQDLEDGRGPLLVFPRLETLTLDSPQVSWFNDLEVLVKRRLGGREDVIGDQVSSFDVVLETWSFSPTRPDSMPDLAQLQRLRAAPGVRSITRASDDHILGMLAAVYDDSTGL
ncbi:hypothetical protein FS837_003079 [Tulasnella sp. UAMH 9824]|nr:hypothetical protein FS837_003079 [Tulasnella sp. UAMH 9824]